MEMNASVLQIAKKGAPGTLLSSPVCIPVNTSCVAHSCIIDLARLTALVKVAADSMNSQPRFILISFWISGWQRWLLSYGTWHSVVWYKFTDTLLVACLLVFICLALQIWRWRQYVSSKRRWNFIGLHVIPYQNKYYVNNDLLRNK